MTTVGEDVKYVTVPGLQADAAWHWAAEAGNLVFTSGAVPHDESGDIGEDLSAGAQADRASRTSSVPCRLRAVRWTASSRSPGT